MTDTKGLKHIRKIVSAESVRIGNVESVPTGLRSVKGIRNQNVSFREPNIVLSVFGRKIDCQIDFLYCVSSGSNRVMRAPIFDTA